jgi:hypothetical protein
MALFRRAVTLRTLARPEQVAAALTKEVKPGSMMQLDLGGTDAREFRGEVRETRFRIVRRVQFRNSFAPILEGRITAIEGGSEVAMSIFVPNSLLLFVIVWTVLAAGAAILVVQTMMLENELETVMTLCMGTIPLVGIAVAWLGYSLEARSSEKLIASLIPPYAGPPTP